MDDPDRGLVDMVTPDLVCESKLLSHPLGQILLYGEPAALALQLLRLGHQLLGLGLALSQPSLFIIK